MLKFEIGQRVRVVKSKDGLIGSRDIGYEGTITNATVGKTPAYNVYYLDYGNGVYEGEVFLIKNNQSSMSDLKSKFANLLTKEPEKSFIKAGVMNNDKTLTTEGTEVFLNWLFAKNQDEFKKEVVDPILEAEEKKKE